MFTTERTRRSRVLAGGTVAVLALMGSLLTATSAEAAPANCATRANGTPAKLMECVTVDGVRVHQRALQRFADNNGGTRASGTPGYTASANYVVRTLRDAGLTVKRLPFDFPFFKLNSSAFAQTAPTPTTYAVDTDYVPMTFSASGDVTAAVQAVDLVLPPTPAPSSTSGCEAADFAGFTPGGIALLQRGTCNFGQKAANAAAAGASAAIIFNEGQPGREEVLAGTLGAPATIPVIGTSFALGSTLGGTTARITVDAISEIRRTENIVAEIKGSNANNVVMVGAHLDSVVPGPGINDNGSGSAAILEVARLMAKSTPRNTLRFAWWGAEELGLLGSTDYVATTTPAQLSVIAAYLNFDMVGSPNFARFVYDGDDSDGVGAGPGPAGSAAIEDVFEKFYTDRNLAYEGTDFDGRSDYGPFIEYGIAAGGLFTGAEGVKTAEQVAKYGGRVGVAFDPCYHQACDTFGNANIPVLDQNSDAIAYATSTLGASTKLVNGVGRNARLAAPTAVAGRSGDAAS
jgi:Zn-dependent M28 family amino/carboxypeptidase